MTDMLRTGQEWLANQLRTHASSPIVYVRGSDQVAVTAIIGRTLMKIEDGYGAIHMQWTDRDFLIAPDELILAGLQVLPERGDTIHETLNGIVYIYEVNAPGAEPPWRWSDPHHTLLRIHTKQIGTN
jgi:hypothetical protein